MEIVTGVVPLKKNAKRVAVFVNCAFICSMSAENAERCGIKRDAEMTVETLLELHFEHERSIAYERSLDYVSKRLRTQKEVWLKLKELGFSEQVREFCTDKLREYGAVNDAEYARCYVSAHRRTAGARKLRFELRARGVADEIIDGALEVLDGGGEAVELLRRRLRTNASKDKAIAFMQRRGFLYDEIKRAFAVLETELECDELDDDFDFE